ncbi:LytR/AlgR family response regulator transcription factor [Teredinibacter waterburyi]|jgi:Two-component response regulator AlgR|uniref:LytR/AlgR family response regulator transcription factor n=1 Tax=Teredinibacter waterburyi TaxID=1500538 RepID=UPI00165F44BE|nr:LytTR family DNA-binding domain-containing protein [Teredinibacter waterburyi]
MHILIVDDEPLARLRLERMIDSIEGYEVVGSADNGADAIIAIDKLDPDIVLLDIRMPGEGGLEAARKIAQIPEPPAVIFCTAYDEYALEAFETLAVGYLLKPVQEQALISALDKTRKLNKLQLSAARLEEPKETTTKQSQRQNISAKTRRGVELIPLESVYCFIADQKYVTVLHANGETLIDDTLKELSDEFGERYVRVHRNTLVAVEQIEGLERTHNGQYELRLKSTDYRPVVSRRHVASLKELLTAL